MALNAAWRHECTVVKAKRSVKLCFPLGPIRAQEKGSSSWRSSSSPSLGPSPVLLFLNKERERMINKSCSTDLERSTAAERSESYTVRESHGQSPKLVVLGIADTMNIKGTEKQPKQNNGGVLLERKNHRPCRNMTKVSLRWQLGRSNCSTAE